MNSFTEKDFIQPFIDGSRAIVSIVFKDGVVSCKAVDANTKKRIKLNKIRDDLVDSYKSSRYFKYPIFLFGTMNVDKKNRTVFIIDDILLKDEYEEKICSKRYETRYENLNIRFLKTKLKNVKLVFNKHLDDAGLGLFVDLFVKTDNVDKAVLRKNIPYKYEEDDVEVLEIWKPLLGEIVGYEKDTAVIKEVDDDKKEVGEKRFDYVKTVTVSYNEDRIQIELTNFTDNEKASMLEKADAMIGKQCEFKEWSIAGISGYLLSKVL